MVGAADARGGEGLAIASRWVVGAGRAARSGRSGCWRSTKCEVKDLRPALLQAQDESALDDLMAQLKSLDENMNRIKEEVRRHARLSQLRCCGSLC